MPERHHGSSEQRYLYNGMEQDLELSGNGNSYTTEFRQYDPRLMRWKSLDPLMAKYPNMSPYVAFNNNPVYFVDPLGLEGGPAKDKPLKINLNNNGSEINNSHNTNWERRHVPFNSNTNIIQALQRTQIGGMTHLWNEQKTVRTYTGYICKETKNFKQHEYYDEHHVKGDWKSITGEDRNVFPNNYLYQDDVTNTFVIRGSYIYHKQKIKRTRIYFDFDTGAYKNTEVDEIIIEQKQYFDHDFESSEDIKLDPNRFFQKRTVKLGEKKVESVELTNEMKRLILDIMHRYRIERSKSDLLDQQQQWDQNFYENVKSVDGDDGIDNLEFPLWKKRK